MGGKVTVSQPIALVCTDYLPRSTNGKKVPHIIRLDMQRTYTPDERARLVRAWAAATNQGKHVLAKSEGMSYGSLGAYVSRWRRATEPCLRRGCSNLTTVAQPYCSTLCSGLDHHTRDVVEAPIVRFLVGKLAQSDLSRSAFSAQLGVRPQTLNGWLKGRTRPGVDAYERIRRRFPDAPDHEPRDDADLRRSLAMALSEQHFHKTRTPEAIRRQVDSRRVRRQRPYSPARAQALSDRVAAGKLDRDAALRSTQRADVRARASLTMRLQNFAGTPDLATVRRWASEVAQARTIHLTAEQLVAGWRPALAARGIRLGGRPRKSARRSLVDDARSRGLSWGDTARLVIEAEGLDRDAGDGEWVRIWRLRQPDRKGSRE